MSTRRGKDREHHPRCVGTAVTVEQLKSALTGYSGLELSRQVKLYVVRGNHGEAYIQIK